MANATMSCSLVEPAGSVPWKLRATLFGQNLLGSRYHTLNQATDFGTYGVRISWDL